MQGYRAIAPRKSVKHFVWKEIAKRQWEERMRAENLNQELRSCLEVESVVHQQLELLRQCLPDENASSNLFMSKVIPRINPVPNDDVVFNKLLTSAEDTLAEIDIVLRGAAYQDRNANYVDASVFQINTNTQAFVVNSSMTMPFCIQVVSRSIWKVLSSDNIKKYCYYHQVVQKSETSIAYTFGCQQTSQGVAADIHGKYVVCRFVDGKRIVIVLVGIFEPVKVNGLPYKGIRCRQTAWIELTNSGDTHTRSRSQCRFTVELGSADPTGQLPYTPLFDVVKAVHEVVSTAVASLLEKVLIEEDWNLNGDPDSVAV
ncbi:hypothetical protein PHMEG_00024666 [Phytophthora megakarya]|uniref:M96 mating-specific protein n=1 Tax=Phytophthora megakarya TaxID=4795 RepID=A0A225VF70_9STRA|nr:hypothetical protein PHMEG_00024666 [Phytophthora megakarya]